MALPIVFGSIVATSGFLSQLDQNFNALGALVPVQCTAAGTNAIVLSPAANQPTVSVYSNYLSFLFVAIATSTGLVTLKFGSLSALPAYGPDGTTQLTTGNIVNGSMYVFYFNQALNGGLGGFTLMSSTPSSAVSFPITVGQGGTSGTTALTARGSGGLNIDQVTSTSFNADSSIAATTRVVASSSTAMTGNHILTLPAAASLNGGQVLYVVDLNGVVTGGFNITVTRAGADTVNGATGVTLSTQFGAVILISDGISKWSAFGISGGGGGASNVQTFTGSGTWTKPGSGNIAYILCWGGGGSGGKSNNNGGGGGGGGAFVDRWVPFASLGATEVVTIGAGGAQVTTNVNGNDGGNTTFGSWVTAFGGGGGLGAGAVGSGGGGGGGLSKGSNSSQGGNPNEDPNPPGTAAIGADREGYSGASGKIGPSSTKAGNSGFGGAGGGSANSTPVAGPGGDSVWGGAGGGGGTTSTPGGLGGTSKNGGNGGNGGFSNTNGTVGAQPGGGGGGSGNGTSNGMAGGAGQVIVIVV